MSNQADTKAAETRSSIDGGCSPLLELVVLVGLHRDVLDAVLYLWQWALDIPDSKLTVMFNGYDDDQREIWEIDRCVEICRVMIEYELLPRLTMDSAWLVYRTATGMPETVNAEYLAKFEKLLA